VLNAMTYIFSLCHVRTSVATYAPVLPPTHHCCHLRTNVATYAPVLPPTYQCCHLRTSVATYAPVLPPTHQCCHLRTSVANSSYNEYTESSLKIYQIYICNKN